MGDGDSLLGGLLGLRRNSDPIAYGQEWFQRQLYGGQTSAEASEAVTNTFMNDQAWITEHIRTDPYLQAMISTLALRIGIPIPRELWMQYNKFWEDLFIPEEAKTLMQSLFGYIWILLLISVGIWGYRRFT